MATVTGLTAERMIESENMSVVGGDIVGDNLVLTTRGGDTINAGSVRGPQGPQGPAISSLDQVADVNAPTPLVGQALVWNGSAWVNQTQYFPTGLILMWSMAAPPTGFLICNGQAVPAGTTYDALRALMANVPDLRSKFIYGANASDVSLGGTGGSKTHTLDATEMPIHNHGKGSLAVDEDGSHVHNAPSGLNFITDASAGNAGLSFSAGGGEAAFTALDGEHTHPVSGSVANTGGGAAHNNMPPYIALNYIIKV